MYCKIHIESSDCILVPQSSGYWYIQQYITLDANVMTTKSKTSSSVILLEKTKRASLLQNSRGRVQYELVGQPATQC